MFNRFLVPLDGSKLAEKAATTAAELARCCRAELVFLMVCADEGAMSKAVDYLEKLGEAARSEGLKVRAEAYFGDPENVILKTAQEEGIDLIVMSSHGRTGLSRTIFGSVAEAVMRRSLCPVMVVKAPPPPGDGDQLRVAVA